MKAFNLIFLFALLIACNDSPTKKTEIKSIKDDVQTYEEKIDKHLESVSQRNSSFLGFEFASTKPKVRNHVKSLIKEGRIRDESTIRFSLINMEVKGYPYTLQVSENFPITTLMDFYFYNDDSLYQISLLPYGENSDERRILRFLEQQYGKATHVAREANKSEPTYYWFKNNYEISYSPTALSTIKFSDLILKKKVLAQQKELNNLIKDVNRESAEQTKKDFQ